MKPNRWRLFMALVAAPAILLSGPTASSEPVDDPDNGQFVPQYEEATSPDAIRGRDLAVKFQDLDILAHNAGLVYHLPYDIPIIGKECGDENAYWDPAAKTITMCYEYFLVADKFAVENSAGDEARYIGLYSAVVDMAFFHETGHMAIDLYDLPATGREEDNADQVAALVLLTDPTGQGAEEIQNAAAFWYSVSTDPASLGAESFADEHSLEQVRAYNLDCWLYGSDPAPYIDLVEPVGPLPK